MKIKQPLLPGAAKLMLLLPLALFGQNPQPRAPAAPQAAAPEDLTGYWVSLVTEDWRFRMITAPKGDYASVPLNAAGKKIADAWDPAKDEAAHNECKAYGAAAIMRVPERLHITWADENTLRVETDAGSQVRDLHFGQAPAQKREPQWQGNSAASWQIFAARGAPARGGYLKVVTTGMRPGYLRKNGVPYSGNAVLTEYYTRVTEPNGDSYLIVTSVVNDAEYLTEPFTTSSNFKRIPDGSGWNPTPCSAR
jgi:hypothetical protein